MKSIRFHNRLRKKVTTADDAILEVQLHIATYDPETANFLTHARERLLALAPDPEDEPPAGPRF